MKGVGISYVATMVSLSSQDGVKWEMDAQVFQWFILPSLVGGSTRTNMYACVGLRHHHPSGHGISASNLPAGQLLSVSVLPWQQLVQVWQAYRHSLRPDTLLQLWNTTG